MIEARIADIDELEKLIKQYGSFNVIANSNVDNLMHDARNYQDDSPSKSSTVPEYISLLCLKYPYSEGINEYIKSPDEILLDFKKINDLAIGILRKSHFLHLGKFDNDRIGAEAQLNDIARTFSSEELSVRGQTFEDHHWDYLEDIYTEYNLFYEKQIGFNISDAISLCIGISDFVVKEFQKSIANYETNYKRAYKEIIDYKYRKIIPNTFYPKEILEDIAKHRDEEIKQHFQISYYTHQRVTLGHSICFTAQQLANFTETDIHRVEKFLDALSISFESIPVGFSLPEVIHPLKKSPLIKHRNKYIVSSIELLDYSVDILFEEEAKKINKFYIKYKKRKHDFLTSKGIEYISAILKTQQFYSHLKYEVDNQIFESDGIILFDNCVFLIEAKSKKISDRAKKGYIDKLADHIEEIVNESHEQAVRTYKYLSNNSNAKFLNSEKKEVVINGAKYNKAFFISLTDEPISAISCNIKISNSLKLFSEETFPWLVSLYDLRVVSEHMESPTYFIHFLERRKAFFKKEKFMIVDELDILGNYLNNSLNFEHINFSEATDILLPSYLNDFNNFYFSEAGVRKKRFPKMKHYTIAGVKDFVRKIELSNLPYRTEVTTQLLNFSKKKQDEFLDYLKLMRKRFSKDRANHDFALGGKNEKGEWILSYFLSPDTDLYNDLFDQYLECKLKQPNPNRLIAIRDTGVKEMKIKEIIFIHKT